jgi:NAD(P)H-quinone oxidoreductase subunit 4L
MTLDVFLLLGLVLFCLGLYGVLARRHLIGILIGIELMLNAASLNVMALNRFVVEDPSVGQVIVLFIVGLAAAEAAIALSIILVVFRSRGQAAVDLIQDLKG